MSISVDHHDEMQKEWGPDFRYEIKCMMYSFGDSKDPNPDSVTLIEKITHSQTAEIVIKTVDVCYSKRRRSVIVEDILFLLRKNTDKLRAVLRHMQLKELAKLAKTVEPSNMEDFNPPSSKKRKYSLDFLNQSDRAIVESEEQDLSSVHTLEQMDKLTEDMNTTEYMHYSRCRQANFHKNTTKFGEWLHLNSLVDTKLSQEVIEVFGYLAYEIVKDLVELSLQVKEDMEHTSFRPRISYSQCPSASSQFGTTPTFFTMPTSDSGSSPVVIEPDHPLASSPVPSNTKQVSTVTTSSSSSAGDHLKSGSRAISPKHVLEAMRRYNYKLGPMAPLTTHFSKSTFYQRTLCT